MMSSRTAAALGLAALSLSGCLQSTQLGGASSLASGSAGSAGGAQGQSAALPRCVAPLGTIALVEGSYTYHSYYGLDSPMPVLRLMVAQSNCFRVVDRGPALNEIQREQLLTGSSGSAQRIVGAQYFLTPNVVFSDPNSGGMSGGLNALSSVLPGQLSSLASSLDLQNSEVQSVLFLTETADGVQVAAAEGSAKNSDLSLRGYGWLGGLGGSAGAYASNDQGKLVVASLVDAYAKLVQQVQAGS